MYIEKKKKYEKTAARIMKISDTEERERTKVDRKKESKMRKERRI